MRSFLSKHQYLVIWISGLVIIGALTVLVIQLNGSFLPTISSLSQPIPAPPAGMPAPIPAPSVTLTIQKIGKQNSLMIQWQNLPNGTTKLYIFRGKGTSTSTWALWKTLTLGQGQLTDGNTQFNLAPGDLGYEYYVQAVSGGGGGQNSTSSEVLWESGAGVPGPSDNGNGGGNGNSGNNNGGGNTSSTQGSQSGNTSSSENGAGNGNGNGGNGNSGGGGNGSGTSGNPYYNPQIQVTGYGTANGDFWAQHVNQSIEIGWQNLPPDTDTIIVTRSQSENGPWNQILAQQNPSLSGSYSLQLVDGTLNEPYYYEMIAQDGTTILGTYGPVYLPPANQ